jgi:hypothetical protein
MLKRELCSPRNKKNGEGKQKPGKTKKMRTSHFMLHFKNLSSGVSH